MTPVDIVYHATKDRDGFPVYYSPDIHLEELRFLPLDSMENDGRFLRPWFRRWTDDSVRDDNVNCLASLFECRFIREFTTELFSVAHPVGVFFAEHRTRFESNTQSSVAWQPDYRLSEPGVDSGLSSTKFHDPLLAGSGFMGQWPRREVLHYSRLSLRRLHHQSMIHLGHLLAKLL